MYKLDDSRLRAVKNFHYEWAERIAKKNISKYLESQSLSTYERDFYNLLYDEDLEKVTPAFKKLIIGKPEELRRFVKLIRVEHEQYNIALQAHQNVGKRGYVYEELKGDCGKWYLLGEQFKTCSDLREYIKEVFVRLKKVFNYDAFIKKKTVVQKPETSTWCGYQLAYQLGARVCVYCNRNYTVTLQINKSGIVRPQLDHFYPKSIYPYLSVSLYNLIPACPTCNANLKLDQVMLNEDFEDEYMHPYEDEICNQVRFEFSIVGSHDITQYFSNIAPEEIRLKLVGLDINPKFERSADLFKLEQLYALHREEFADIMNLVNSFSESSLQEVGDLLSLNSYQRHSMKKELVTRLSTQSPDKKSLGKAINDLLDFLKVN